MKFLVILGLFLAQQTVVAKGLMSRSTRHLLESGLMFKLELQPPEIECYISYRSCFVFCTTTPTLS